MGIAYEPPSQEGWKELVTTLVEDNPHHELIQSLGELRGQIVEHLRDASCSNEALLVDMMSVQSISRSCLASPSLNLNPQERIALLYAFRDLTDDIRTHLIEKIEKRTIAQRVGTYVPQFLSRSRDVSEEDCILQVNEIQAAYKEVEHAFKQVVTDIEFDFTVYETMHSKKVEEAKQKAPSLFTPPKTYTEIFYSTVQFLSDTVSSTMSGIGQKAAIACEAVSSATNTIYGVAAHAIETSYEKATQYKDEQVKQAVEPLKPEKLLQGKEFKELLGFIVEKELEDKTYMKAPGAHLIRDRITEHYRKNISENLSLFQDQKNAARLCVACNKELAHVLRVERELAQGASQEDFIHALGYPDLNAEQFKMKMESAIVENIGCIISRDGRFESNKETSFVSQGIFKGIKNIINRFKNKIVSKIKMNITKKKFEKKSKKLQPKGVQALKSAESIAKMMGVEGELNKIEQHAELLVYYLIYIATTELVAMIQEAGADKEKNVSGFADATEAQVAFNSSLDAVLSELGQFHPKEDATYLQQGTFWLATTVGSACVSQQKASGLLNVAEPAYNELYGAWIQWLSAK